MSTFLKSFIPVALIIGLVGCNHSSKKTSQKGVSKPSQAQVRQQLSQMGKKAPKVNLTDKEAGQFAQAAMNAQKVQMKAQQQMIGIIKKHGLDIKTYQKIAMAKRKNKSAQPKGVSKSDMKKFKHASKAMQKAQPAIQKKVTAAIKKTGMKMQRFQKISMAARQDTQLQNQIRQQIRKLQQSQAPSSKAPASK